MEKKLCENCVELKSSIPERIRIFQINIFGTDQMYSKFSVTGIGHSCTIQIVKNLIEISSLHSNAISVVDCVSGGVVTEL